MDLLAIKWAGACEIAAGAAVLIFAFFMARTLERLRPIENHDSEEDRREIKTDLKHAVLNKFVLWLAAPVSAFCAGHIIDAVGGGGIIDLTHPQHWYTWLGGFLLVLFTYDAYKYWAHRLDHMIPFLWKLHSFHHSAERLTIVTGARHQWLSGVVNASYFPIMAILFKITPEMTTAILALYFLPEGFAHLNYRFPFALGRFVAVLNNPQWHRIHHSVEPEHIDKNFASLFPFMDIIFGTAYIPAKDEFPSTGLVPSERPGALEGLLWPIRNVVRSMAFLNRKNRTLAAMDKAEVA
jgi:sterol desaturase/sphingolipid hydroxylase (fatty acid hydroxylase superfamily)